MATNRKWAWRWAGIVAIALLVTSRPTDIGQATQGRGTGYALEQDCALYFEFLGRTGAGRDEAFEVDPFGMGYCAGVVRGIAESAGGLLDDRVCLPENVTSAQAVWTVVQYLQRYPDARYESDATLVLRALEAAYPCRPTSDR